MYSIHIHRYIHTYIHIYCINILNKDFQFCPIKTKLRALLVANLYKSLRTHLKIDVLKYLIPHSRVWTGLLSNRFKEWYLWLLSISCSGEINVWLIVFSTAVRKTKSHLQREVHHRLLDVCLYHTHGNATCCVFCCVLSWIDLFLFSTTVTSVCAWF